MADKNKFEKLRKIEYVVPDHCGTCAHGSFLNPQSQWGKCLIFQYKHAKTGNVDGVSIVRAGHCKGYVYSIPDAAYLGAHSEFLVED